MTYDVEINSLMSKAADEPVVTSDERWEAIDRFLNLLDDKGYVIVKRTDVKTSRRGMCGGF